MSELRGTSKQIHLSRLHAFANSYRAGCTTVVRQISVGPVTSNVCSGTRKLVFDHLHGFPERSISEDSRGEAVTSPGQPTYGDAQCLAKLRETRLIAIVLTRTKVCYCAGRVAMDPGGRCYRGME